jgi:D-aminopeptidase
VREAHVWQAIETAAEGPVAEGNVGGGTGALCFGFKGGIGTASRQLFDGRITVGALVQTNFGARQQLLVLGAPIGKHFADRLLPGEAPETDAGAAPGQGSIMMVLATDAPAPPHLLLRMAKRAAFGLARTGSLGEDGSGDFVIAFATTNRQAQYERPPDDRLAPPPTLALSDDPWTRSALFAAVVEAVEEAILNALVAAETLIGRDRHIAYALPHDELVDLLTYYRRR